MGREGGERDSKKERQRTRECKLTVYSVSTMPVYVTRFTKLKSTYSCAAEHKDAKFASINHHIAALALLSMSSFSQKNPFTVIKELQSR